jgi:hypothetical protein
MQQENEKCPDITEVVWSSEEVSNMSLLRNTEELSEMRKEALRNATR